MKLTGVDSKETETHEELEHEKFDGANVKSELSTYKNKPLGGRVTATKCHPIDRPVGCEGNAVNGKDAVG